MLVNGKCSPHLSALVFAQHNNKCSLLFPLGPRADLVRRSLASKPAKDSFTYDAAMAADATHVMLAETWQGEDISGWWISEKLDGMRAYWSGSNFYTRLGNPVYAPKWFTKGLPSTPLDGELWCGHRQFRKCVSITKRQDQSDDWKYITYFVFDAPRQAGKFEQRIAYVNDVVQPGKTPYAAAVGMRRCKDKDHMLAQLKIVEDAGGEGLMLRKPGSDYVHARSNVLLKVKTFVDEEAIVVGHGKGSGRNSHRMGHLECKTPDGREFSVGSGFTDKERDRPPKIGSVITYKYQELTEKSNKPRFPTFVGVRTDIDWKDYCKNYKSPVDDLPAMPTLKLTHSLLYGGYGATNHFATAAGAAVAAAASSSSSSSAPAAAPASPAAPVNNGKRKVDADKDAEDDDADTTAPSKKAKKAPTAAADDGSDTDNDEDDSNDDRPPCKYGATCYRKNKAHLDEYYHPPLPKAPSASSSSSSSAPAPAAAHRPRPVLDHSDTILMPAAATPVLDHSDTIIMPPPAADPKPAMLQRFNSANFADDEDDAQTKNDAAIAAALDDELNQSVDDEPSPPPAAATAAHADADKSKKPACRFGAKCYRKNPDHFKEFSHDTAGVNDDDD